MRFDNRGTGKLKTCATNARKIHVEVDPSEINKNVKVDVALVADLRLILEQIVPRVRRRERAQWLARINELKGDSAVRDIQSLPDRGRLHAAHVIHDLWRLTGGNAVALPDGGQR